MALLVREMRSVLSGWAKRLTRVNAQKPLRMWGEELAGELGEGFLSSKAPDGSQWAPLKNPRPAGHNPGSRPLIDFGDMMQSVIADSVGHIENNEGNFFEYGTDDDKAKYHQFGTKNIPARPFVGVSDKMADRAAEIIGDHIADILGE